ncbi:protein phosphatase 2C domain-containing protein [Streptomyces sp. NPDC091412]|uniref:protein phosphatase 2C domain-containing protein n=1 Tax=Streptomyces sp. NPDC091412 TaxID=3366002 RepID=UPI00380DE6E6
MSQQGGRPTGQEDDWWGQLYDDSAEDTGPAAGADSLDDRFASASGTVDGPPRGAPLPTPRPPDPAPDWWRSTPEDTASAADRGSEPAEPASGGAWGSGPGESERSPWSASRAEGEAAEADREPGTGTPERPSQPPVPAEEPPAGGAWSSGPVEPVRSPRSSAPAEGPAAGAAWDSAPMKPAQPPVSSAGTGDGRPSGSAESTHRGGTGSGSGGPSPRDAADPAGPAARRLPSTPPPPPAPPSPSSPPSAPATASPPPSTPSPPSAPPAAPPPPSASPRSSAPPPPSTPPSPPEPPSVGAVGGSGREVGGGEAYDPPAAGEAYAVSGGAEAEEGPAAGEAHAASRGVEEAYDAPPGVEAYDVPAAREANAATGGVEAHSAPGAGQAHSAPAAGKAYSVSGAGEAHVAPPDAGAHVAPRARGGGVVVGYVGARPPTYAAEPTALPGAEPDGLDVTVPDTVLDGAAYGACTLRAVSIRGDSARYRGESRRDALLTARFGAGDQALVLVAMATGARATPGAHRAAGEVCQWIAEAVGRSHARLAEDIRAARRGDLKSGLHRLTDRSLGRLRAGAAEQGVEPEQYTATLRCLLLPADPDCRVRVFFGVGAGGLFRLREGEWQDIEPGVAETPGHPVVGFGSPPSETPDGDRLTMDLGITTPPNPYDPAPEPPREPFRFRASVAQPGDTLLMCTAGLADPLRGEPELCAHLSRRWSDPAPPGLAAFLADAQVRVKGYADDRTAAAVWEA